MARIILNTFWFVLIAELGDKTQVETMLLTAKSGSPFAVFIGSSLALICSSLIAVYAGTFITKYVPAHFIENIAGIIFIVLGFLILFHKI